MSRRIFPRILLMLTPFEFLTAYAANTTPTSPAPIAQTPSAITTPTTKVSIAAATVAPAVAIAPTPTVNRQPSIIPTAPSLNSNGYVLMDANTGMILAHKNMHTRMEPASLTKLMTLYITSQAISRGQIKLTDQVRVSERAWKTGGSRMFIKENSTVSVQDLIDGIIVASGNDACVALSQFVGGNEATFTQMMNQAAQQIGMKDSHYVDSTGLPDPAHYTTPYDMALLTRAIINDFPQDYAWYKQKWITYNGIKQPNRNRLLWRDTSVDGLKTGHTQEAGYCLISSAVRDGMRLIAIVMGSPTDAERSDDSEALLNWGFRFYQTHKLFDGDQALAHPRVWLGSKKTVPIGLGSALYVTIPTGSYPELKPQVNINTALRAPIKKGQAIGTLNIQLQNTVLTSVPLIALKDDAKGSVFSRLWDHMAMIF